MATALLVKQKYSTEYFYNQKIIDGYVKSLTVRSLAPFLEFKMSFDQDPLEVIMYALKTYDVTKD